MNPGRRMGLILHESILDRNDKHAFFALGIHNGDFRYHRCITSARTRRFHGKKPIPEILPTSE